MSKIVLVTGSRDLKDYTAVYSALDLVYAQFQPMIVIHGGARGADAFADAWATFRVNVTPVRVAADWENDGRAAGHLRNSRMLELGPELVLAFFQNGAGNYGTRDMVRQSRDAGLEVRTFTVD